jgi:hypothetical protein
LPAAEGALHVVMSNEDNDLGATGEERNSRQRRQAVAELRPQSVRMALREQGGQRRASMPALPSVTKTGPLSQAAAAAEQRRALLRSKFAKLRSKISEDDPSLPPDAPANPLLSGGSTNAGAAMAPSVVSVPSSSTPAGSGSDEEEPTTTQQLWAQLNDTLLKLQGQQQQQQQQQQDEEEDEVEEEEEEEAYEAFVRSMHDPAFGPAAQLRQVVERFQQLPWLPLPPPLQQTVDEVGAGLVTTSIGSANLPTADDGGQLMDTAELRAPAMTMVAASAASTAAAAVASATTSASQQLHAAATNRASGSLAGVSADERAAGSSALVADTDDKEASGAHAVDHALGSQQQTAGARADDRVCRVRADSLNDSEVTEDTVSAVLAHPRTTVSVCGASSFGNVVFYAVSDEPACPFARCSFCLGLN